MPTLLPPITTPRYFAEFVVTRSWQEIGLHVRRLHSATFLGFTGRGEKSCLRFEFCGHDFCIHEADRIFTISVDDRSCPEALIRNVQRHFANLLAPNDLGTHYGPPTGG
ncbi:MAG: hypothetical protein C0485_19470 [Pirellula sp.]|nr:hypothetical protein [Pirellula sp.]